MLTSAEVVKHSVSSKGVHIYTLALRYPRFIHGEFMTHRVFSRNASSSRAIPINRMIGMTIKDPARPIFFGSNKAGMQAGKELPPIRKMIALVLWFMACYTACAFSWLLSKTGLHKQHCNRITEPFQYITVLLTCTHLDNFMHLRNHPDAQPEIQKLAKLMQKAIDASEPTPLYNGWHIPYVTKEELEGDHRYRIEDLLRFSAARCARVSYLNHDGTKPSVIDDLKLYHLLVGSNPKHMSPVEHQALALHSTKQSANFKGFRQYRWFIERGEPITALHN